MDNDNKCIFCQIIEKKIKSHIITEDDLNLAFYDVRPVADTHIIIIPKVHISSINEISIENKDCIFNMLFMAKKIAKDQFLSDNGYRLVINTGKDANQTVFHLHLHMLAGRKFSWPPG